MPRRSLNVWTNLSSQHEITDAAFVLFTSKGLSEASVHLKKKNCNGGFLLKDSNYIIR